MQVFTYSEARQDLSRLLLLAHKEEEGIRRRDGTIFSLKSKKGKQLSPLDAPGIKTKATTANILSSVKDSRMG